MTRARADTANWISYGRDYAEQRYSPLDQVNAENVGELGLAWFADMDTARGQEATPLVIDGKLYLTTAWSKVKAFDAATGKPAVGIRSQGAGRNRGQGLLRRGQPRACGVGRQAVPRHARWPADRARPGDRQRSRGKVTVDQSKSYTITGAPRVIDGKVIIGNGGAEFGVRGFVAAYDATAASSCGSSTPCPKAPEKDEPAYRRRLPRPGTWTWWNDAIGGGGTVWDSMAYDPELDLLYIGVGNGSPWNRAYRSPARTGGEGDNLYLSSIVAIRPETGEYVWHYQTTPGETWDFTATQHIMLADIEIEGQQRRC
jgi:quinohemoprotein ethanol dehydrogenase